MNNFSYYLNTCPNFIKNNFLNIRFNTFDKILIQNQSSSSVYIIKTGVKQGEGDFCAPCSVCRQVMAKFWNLKTFKVIIAKSTGEYLEYTLDELLPLAFTGKDLD